VENHTLQIDKEEEENSWITFRSLSKSNKLFLVEQSIWWKFRHNFFNERQI